MPSGCVKSVDFRLMLGMSSVTPMLTAMLAVSGVPSFGQPGFHSGFVEWWKTCHSRTHGAPAELPWVPPETPVACAIFDSMQVALRQFEKELQKSSRLFAKLRRDSNPNAIFQDLRDFQPNGVDMLLQQSSSRVVEVPS